VSGSSRISLVLLALLVGASSLEAQRSPVTPDDYGQWETLGTGTLSPDGKWLAAPVDRVNEEDELRIHSTERDSVVVVPFGTGPVFSDDGGWVAYEIGKSDEQRDAAEDEGEGEADRNDMGLVNLVTGEQFTLEEVASYAFGGGGDYLLMRRYPATDDASAAPILVRDLSGWTDVSFGSVASSLWQDEGTLLAFIVHADEEVGNGVQVYDARSGTLRALDGAAARYAQLTWREDTDDLAVLRAFTSDARADTSHVLLAWRGLENDRRALSLNPLESNDIPDDRRIVSYRDLVWSEDGSALFFGVKDWDAAEEDASDADEDLDNEDSKDDTATDSDSGEGAEDDEPAAEAEVEIWNSADLRVLPEQKRDETRDRQRNDLGVWHLDTGRAVVLTDETLDEATVRAGGRVVTAVNDDPYAFEGMFGRQAEDVYRIDVRTGERLRVIEGTSFRWEVSPEGDQLVHFGDGAYHVVDLANGATRVISAQVRANLNNVDFDHPVAEKPPFGSAGWSTDGQSVLVYDKYDMWRLGVDGSADKLTDGATDQIVYRYASVDDATDDIDLSGDVYISGRAEWTLNHGYARLRDGQVDHLVYEDNNLSSLIKAGDADVFAYVAQDFDDPPDYFVADATFRSPRQVTAVNRFHEDYAWGRSELVQYTNHQGRQLHGALFYPADYDPGQSYPMITYIYEIRSQSAKQYNVPSERSYYNWAVWTARGYFVWQPDIVFDPRDPGISSSRTMEASIAAVVDSDVGVDPERVGLVGHSWGGYQAAFAATNTNVFAAIVAGAALTDLISMYGSIFWSSSTPESGHFEVGQERMDVPYWEDLDAYLRNSAVFNIETLNTPLLIEAADADRNVDWRQAIEYFNVARRAGKPLVMLAYHNEGHGLRKEANQVDYHRRILQWFGHHLKGDEAPDWIKSPVPYLEQTKGR
jgi:dipeptidyl aminopeptidase/acylaminoacyl peptidase